ncbi:hypothetical protein ACFL24_00365 [Patescibacteria group bacterium]
MENRELAQAHAHANKIYEDASGGKLPEESGDIPVEERPTGEELQNASEDFYDSQEKAIEQKQETVADTETISDEADKLEKQIFDFERLKPVLEALSRLDFKGMVENYNEVLADLRERKFQADQALKAENAHGGQRPGRLGDYGSERPHKIR